MQACCVYEERALPFILVCFPLLHLYASWIESRGPSFLVPEFPSQAVISSLPGLTSSNWTVSYIPGTSLVDPR